MPRERLAVQRIGEKRFGRQRLVARQASAELLVHFELLRPELHLLFAMIGAKEDELLGFRPDVGPVEHSTQRQTSPSTVAREALHDAAPVSRALEPGSQLASAHGSELI